MPDDKIVEVEPAKTGYWFRNPVNIFLIAVVLVIVCCYLVNPVIELFQAS